jgi:hypothetical protein
MTKSKHIIVKQDTNGDLHFKDGYFLPWTEIWEEANSRAGKKGSVYSKFNQVIRDKHNLWKMDHPFGLAGGKVPSTDLARGGWREWYNDRKAMGLVSDINEYGSVKKGKEGSINDNIPDECIRCLKLLECCEGETTEARKIFKKRMALFKKINFCEDYEPDLTYINRGF